VLARRRGRLSVMAGLASIALLALSLTGVPTALAGQNAAHHGTTAPELSSAAPLHRLPAGYRLACPPALRPGQAECMSVQQRPASSGSSAPSGYSPASLRSAYKLTKSSDSGGRGETVAIVEAFRDPAAAADLAVYRSHYKLPACTRPNGCLRIINEHGGSKLPAANRAWATDQTIGLDAVSALCPHCHLLLVEASSNSLQNLGTAEDTAAQRAKFVFNGWGSQEAIGQDSDAHYFNHPGVAIVFSSGDNGYGATFPADLQYVTSVGGTSLKRSKFNTRHWAETAWADTGSGCSSLEPKPSWQRLDASAPDGCLNRTGNDVGADANPSTGIATYDTYGSHGWTKAGGVSVAAAIVTAAYALAGNPAPRTYPASYPYQQRSHLFDVQFGTNGGCDLNRQYLCTAAQGFDGPTGLGTPDGAAGFAASSPRPVTLADPGTQDNEASTSVTIHIAGFDGRQGAAALAYTAVGLPAGLSIKSVPHSTNANITGTLSAKVGSFAVTVTARDKTTGKTGSTHFTIVAAGSLTPSAPITAAIATDTSTSLGPAEGQCLDSGAGTAGTTVGIETCTGTAEQLWTYLPEGAPGAPDELISNGLCLSLVAASVQLASCDRSDATQSWRLLFGGTLKNIGSGTCLETGSGFTDPITMQGCNSTIGFQQWHLIGATLQSAVPGMCMAVNDNGADPASYMIEPCGNGGLQGFGFNNDGSVLSSLDRCMIGEGTRRDGAGVASGFCDAGAAQDWFVSPSGELINAGSGLCLDDPGNSKVAGTQLVLEDCYGTLGEIWAIA
jgi:hypothetical protein